MGPGEHEVTALIEWRAALMKPGPVATELAERGGRELRQLRAELMISRPCCLVCSGRGRQPSPVGTREEPAQDEPCWLCWGTLAPTVDRLALYVEHGPPWPWGPNDWPAERDW